jgi:hypothetical protein
MDSNSRQAGFSGDCIANADSSLVWRRLARFVTATVIAGFVMNEIWEMVQMPAFVETAGRTWTSTLALCTRAAAGDVGIILGICALGTFTLRRQFWGWFLPCW